MADPQAPALRQATHGYQLEHALAAVLVLPTPPHARVFCGQALQWPRQMCMLSLTLIGGDFNDLNFSEHSVMAGDTNRAGKRLLVGAIGLSTALLTAVGVGLLQANTDFSLYSFSLMVVLPVGAVACGALATSGYYIGSKALHQKPAGGVAINMIATAIGCFLLINYIPYFMLEIDGIRVMERISFWQYLDINIQSTSLMFFKARTETGELGLWGYLFALIDVAGFAFGGFMVFGFLSAAPYCDTCSLYMKKSSTTQRFTSDADGLSEKYAQMIALMGESKWDEALQYQATEMGEAKAGKHSLRSQVIVHTCESCGERQLDVGIAAKGSNSWDDLKDTVLAVRVAPPQAQPPEAMA